MKIETNRLIVRNYEKADIEDVAIFLLDKKVMYYIPEVFETMEDVTSFVMKEKEQDKFFSVVLKETGKVIGHLSFEPFFGEHSYEVGWVFNPNYHQKGYAKEAAYALLDFGFKEKKIHRIIATCQPDNPGSWHLMESLGMRREGFFKKCIPFGDTWWDEYYYAVLREEWPIKKLKAFT